MPDYTRITRRGLAQELGSTLGEENAWQCVITACRELDLEQWVLNRDEALRVLGLLRKQAGLVGITARALALKIEVHGSRRARGRPATCRQRIHNSSSPASTTEPVPVPAITKNSSSPVSLRATPDGPGETLTLDKLAQMLGNSIGAAEARSLLTEVSAELSIKADAPLTRREAGTVLEFLKKHPGLVGVSAHFLSTRLHMLISR